MEVSLPAAERRTAVARTSSTSSPTRSAATRCCTSSSRPSIAASGATRIRWRSCAASSARSAPSITTATDITDPQQRMIASHRLIAKMPTIAAMAYKYSVGQPFLYPDNNAQLHRQLPAHDVRRAGRGICRQPGRREGDGPHLHPPCRSRAERLDLDRAARRFVGRQPVRVHRGGHRLPVGPGAWRRQRGGAQHAARDRHARQASPSISRAPRTRTIRSA